MNRKTWVAGLLLVVPLLSNAKTSGDQDMKDPLAISKVVHSIPAYQGDLGSRFATGGMGVDSVWIHVLTKEDVAEDPMHFATGDGIPVISMQITTVARSRRDKGWRTARHIAGYIEDGATLQLGIGAIPEAVLGSLAEHRDLGVHSGSIGDGVAQLMESGVITNARKTIDTGKTVAGVLIGSAKLHRFVHRNPDVLMRSTDYVHHPDVLANIDRLVAINSAIEVDLTGQVNAEVANGSYLGAVGGGGDFLRGAARSRGGVPIIALPSTSKSRSRIVDQLSGPVSTPRCDVGLVVTEFGVADLRGLSLKQRVKRMLDIAHTDFRAELARATNI